MFERNRRLASIPDDELLPGWTALAAQVNVRRSHHDLGEHGCIVQNIERQGSLHPPLRH
jgi:hypothetical protein